jgi:glycosyltransferase involved in cell wall biosynthesis
MTSTLTLGLRARNVSPARPRYQICLIHPFDPRGEKVGGLETYIRDFITFHPADTDLLFIGVDSVGDLKLGEIHKLTFRSRNFDFLPILRYSDQQAREAARSIRTSLTGQFFVALLRHFGPIAKLIRARRCSIDLRRVEFSWLPALLRLPFIQMLHGEGAPKLQMDSLLRKYSFVHNAGERFAVATSAKFLCVNPFITERLQNTYPSRREKIDTLWTWVNTDIFQPQPLPADTTPFRIVFAGRLDEFKDPPLMFRTIARLRQRWDGGVEFHYIGTSDPHRFA